MTSGELSCDPMSKECSMCLMKILTATGLVVAATAMVPPIAVFSSDLITGIPHPGRV